MCAAGARFITLISITIILLFNFEKKKKNSYVFLFLRNFKMSFPSVFTVYFGLFLREKRRKNLTINLNNFLLTSGGGICDALRESPWRARCWEAMYEVVQRHHIKIYQASFFFLSHVKFIPF